MLFLDTNAFYYAAGISTASINLPGLVKLISENETCIAVISLHEFLVKFRNDIGVIKKGLQFLADYHIKTAYNKFFPKPENLEYINVDMSESELDTFVQSILQEKIDIESRFASIIFTSCFFSGAAFSAAKNIDSGMTYAVASEPTKCALCVSRPDSAFLLEIEPFSVPICTLTFPTIALN